jgi:hypothetical protein
MNLSINSGKVGSIVLEVDTLSPGTGGSLSEKI